MVQHVGRRQREAHAEVGDEAKRAGCGAGSRLDQRAASGRHGDPVSQHRPVRPGGRRRDPDLARPTAPARPATRRRARSRHPRTTHTRRLRPAPRPTREAGPAARPGPRHERVGPRGRHVFGLSHRDRAIQPAARVSQQEIGLDLGDVGESVRQRHGVRALAARAPQDKHLADPMSRRRADSPPAGTGRAVRSAGRPGSRSARRSPRDRGRP